MSQVVKRLLFDVLRLQIIITFHTPQILFVHTRFGKYGINEMLIMSHLFNYSAYLLSFLLSTASCGQKLAE